MTSGFPIRGSFRFFCEPQPILLALLGDTANLVASRASDWWQAGSWLVRTRRAA